MGKKRYKNFYKNRQKNKKNKRKGLVQSKGLSYDRNDNDSRIIDGIMTEMNKDKYLVFKENLIKEMEQRRDILVAESQEKSFFEPVFEISDQNDKLYRSILGSFNNLATSHSERLLHRLCREYCIEATLLQNDQYFDFLMQIGDDMCYVELKTTPLWDVTHEARVKFYEKVRKCGKPVYLIYLLYQNTESLKLLQYHKEENISSLNGSERLHVVLIEDFLDTMFGRAELHAFRKAMSTFKAEMHEVIGYSVTDILNEKKYIGLKEDLEKEFLSFPFERIKTDRYEALHRTVEFYEEIEYADYMQCKDSFLVGGRYKVLLGRRDFAKSFLTTEWLYRKYVASPHMDNTFVVAGCMKSIEQLLWEVISLVGQGRCIKVNDEDVMITKEKPNIYAPLGSLINFIVNSSNRDLLETDFLDSKVVSIYLEKQLKYWLDSCRNSLFHKHNLEIDRIRDIRDSTIYIHMLILGAVRLTGEELELLMY